MNKKARKIFKRLYRSAESFEDLPWHDSEPPPLLVQALDQRDSVGHALDVGCGAGTYSLYMAGRGYSVTAIDFMPEAIEILRRRAAAAGQTIEVAEADVTTWSCDKRFDVVLDVGCLHSPNVKERQVYKRQLLQWLAPGGDYILTHFGRRGWWDGWPIGPRRVAHENVVALFAPELTLQEYIGEQLTDMPWSMGRTAMVGRYWFRSRVGC
jgi:2-polyprenyl-3-methyl-5-hydroxy-6-metoxy-1,4-benzoquinol methylase